MTSSRRSIIVLAVAACCLFARRSWPAGRRRAGRSHCRSICFVDRTHGWVAGIDDDSLQGVAHHRRRSDVDSVGSQVAAGGGMSWVSFVSPTTGVWGYGSLVRTVDGGDDVEPDRHRRRHVQRGRLRRRAPWLGGVVQRLVGVRRRHRLHRRRRGDLDGAARQAGSGRLGRLLARERSDRGSAATRSSGAAAPACTRRPTPAPTWTRRTLPAFATGTGTTRTSTSPAPVWAGSSATPAAS